MRKIRLFYWLMIAFSAIVLVLPFDIVEIKPIMLLLPPACIFLDYQEWKEEKYGGA
jgi:hypothetical protein